MKRMKDRTIMFRQPSAAVRRADVEKLIHNIFGMRTMPYTMKAMLKHAPFYRVIVNKYRR